ncbi:MAG: ABC-2 family transporter protein [Tetrasphaera sp.]
MRTLPYLLLLRAGFRSQATYRLAAAAGLFTNAVFGVVKAAVLIAAVGAAGGTLAGYSTGEMLAYVWVSQGLIGVVAAMGVAEIGERIRTGDVATDFTRPLDVQGAHLCSDLGARLFTLLPRGLPCVLVGALITGMSMPSRPLPYLLGTIAMLIGAVLSFYCGYAVAILGFWVVDVRGINTLYTVLSGFGMGLYVPVALFPGWLQTLAIATPFPSMMMTPTDIFIGRLDGPDSLRAIGIQLVWVALAAIAGRALTRAGRRRLEVQGG